jgi:hypothetical protein
LRKVRGIAEQKEVPNEEAKVETVGGLGDRYGERRLVVGRLRQLKKRIQGSGGSWQKLATTC